MPDTLTSPPNVVKRGYDSSDDTIRVKVLGGANGDAADAAATNSTSSWSAISLLKGIFAKLAGVLKVDTVIAAASTDVGGTITTGGQAQQFAVANSSRRGLVVQNQSTGDLWVNGTGNATIDYHSLRVRAGDYYETPAHHVGTGALSIIGATTGQAFYARVF